MYELAIQSSFTAAHALVIDDQRETPHQHDWKVTVEVAGDQLDRDNLLVDFHELERILEEIIAPFRESDLNQIHPFDIENPTAERVAEYIACAFDGLMPARYGARLKAVRLTEAPGCVATYRPD